MSLYRNNQGSFEHVPATPLQGGIRSDAVWGDYDNDGDLDILATSFRNLSTSDSITRIYENQGGTFTDELVIAGSGYAEASIAWGDADNDGDLDVLLAGTEWGNQSTAKFELYLNDTQGSKDSPTAPSELTAAIEEDSNGTHQAILSWNIGGDSNLTYNVRVGTSPGSGDILSGMMGQDGTRLLPAPGNARTATSLILNGLSDGTYYWSVQSVNAAFSGSTLAPEQSFNVGQSEPQAVAPEITQMIRDEEGVLTLWFQGAPGATNYQVEHSLDLKTWEVIADTPTEEVPGRFKFTDSEAADHPSGYYRVVR